MSEETKAEMNLYQKIVAVRKSVGNLTKDGQSHGYSYVSGNQILTSIKDKMNDLNLLLIPSAIDGKHETYDYVTKYKKDKTDFIVSGTMTYTWINGDNPDERLEVPWFYFGQMDDISKAFGSALTYSERYFLLKVLGLPTDGDDPDARQPEPKGQQPMARQKSPGGQGLSEPQIKRFYAIARGGGYSNQKAEEALNKKYGFSDPYKLTRKQYDEVCSAMDKK